MNAKLGTVPSPRVPPQTKIETFVFRNNPWLMLGTILAGSYVNGESARMSHEDLGQTGHSAGGLILSGSDIRDICSSRRME